VRQQVFRFLIVGLIVILGMQLTGLTCLSDRLGDSSNHDAFVQYLSGTEPGSEEMEQPDGCPCHLHFVSIEKILPSRSFPGIFLTSSAPHESVLLLEFAQFRPPATI
jgi:hypothetical protein